METRHTLSVRGGATLAYRRWRCPSPTGRAPLVLVHGAASNLTRWTEFLEETTVKDGRDVVRLDLRGHGESLWRGATSLEIWCDDIAAILAHEAIAGAVLAGHCLGANIAVMFAARHPKRSAGLVLVEPMLHDALTGRLRALRRLTPLLRILIGSIRVLNRLGLHRRRLDTLDLQALDREFRARLTEPRGGEALAKRYASTLHDLRIMPTAGYLQDLVEVVRPLPLARIDVPLLALLAAGQPYSNSALTRTALEGVPCHELRILACQHWVPTEQPTAMRESIEGWLARTGL